MMPFPVASYGANMPLARRVIRSLCDMSVVPVLRCLGGGESIAKAEFCRFPPVFIIGPPRSGTTLLYQCMVHCFRLAYICNLAALCPTAPAAATRLALRLSRHRRTSFSSRYGATRGLLGPHEGWPIWNRWMVASDGSDCVSARDLSEQSRRMLHCTIAGIEAVFDRPFINKMVDHSLRLGALDATFPGCAFLVMERDRLDVASSMLNGWREHVGNRDRWWSAKPRNYVQLQQLRLVERVCGQLFAIDQEIGRGKELLGAHRFLTIHYLDLCNDPQATMERIQSFAYSNGVTLTGSQSVPKAFSASLGVSLANQEAQATSRVLNDLYGAADSFPDRHV